MQIGNKTAAARNVGSISTKFVILTWFVDQFLRGRSTERKIATLISQTGCLKMIDTFRLYNIECIYNVDQNVFDVQWKSAGVDGPNY